MFHVLELLFLQCFHRQLKFEHKGSIKIYSFSMVYIYTSFDQVVMYTVSFKSNILRTEKTYNNFEII